MPVAVAADHTLVPDSDRVRVLDTRIRRGDSVPVRATLLAGGHYTISAATSVIDVMETESNCSGRGFIAWESLQFTGTLIESRPHAFIRMGRRHQSAAWYQIPSPSSNCSSRPIRTPRRSSMATASCVASRLASIALGGAKPVTITISPAAFASASESSSASAMTATSAPRSNSSRSSSSAASESSTAITAGRCPKRVARSAAVTCPRVSSLPSTSTNHARAERFIRQRIDHDERAGDAVLRVGVEEQRTVRLDRDLADLVQFEPLRFHMRQRVHVQPVMDAADHAAHLMRGVLDEIAAAGFERLRVHPHDARTETPGHMRRGERGHDHVAAADIDLVFETNRDRLRRVRRCQIAIVSDDALDARMAPRRQRQHQVALAEHARSQLPRIAAEIQIGPQHILHRENARASSSRPLSAGTSSRYSSSAGPVVPGAARALLDHVIAIARADRNEQRRRARRSAA